MARLSTRQIADGLRGAGFSEDIVPTMTAVVMAESGGNPYAHNPNRSTGDNSFGLGQINMIDSLGPERRRQYGISRNEDLFDPATNFRAMKNVFDSQGITAWGAYTNGSYKKFMGSDTSSSNRGVPTLRPASTAGAGTQQNQPKKSAGLMSQHQGLGVETRMALAGLPGYELLKNEGGRLAGDRLGGKDTVSTAALMPQATVTSSSPAGTTGNSRLLGHGMGKQRTIEIGKQLQAQGFSMWQHPDFHIDKGYTGSGNERVMRRSYNSAHHHGEALDFALSHNTEERLDQLFAYFDNNRERLGVSELLWKNDPNHFDHLHVGFKQ